MDRRTFLKTMGVGGLAMLNSDALVAALRKAPAGAFQPQVTTERDPHMHLINRLTFGMTPALYRQHKQLDIETWVATQLAPERIDDHDLDDKLQAFPELNRHSAEHFENGVQVGELLPPFINGWTLRATYSERQLYERLVHFWSDHFYVYIRKNIVTFFKVDEDRDAIRPNALGKFRTLLGASAKSPAMLYYLDNQLSNRAAPNENYARELLELHTLGVDGGYTEDDVKAVARALTGWSITRPQDLQPGGHFLFRRFAHDRDEKTILGITLPAGQGIEDGEAVLDLLSSHPATARFVMTKLAKRFVSDTPSPALIENLVQTFISSDGDTITVMRALLASDEFWQAPPKLKRPFEYTISLLRALNYDVRRPEVLAQILFEPLMAMGHVPFHWPAPNGYPDDSRYWINNLLPRWNMAISLLEERFVAGPDFTGLSQLIRENGLRVFELDAVVPFLGHYLFGRDLTEIEQELTLDFAHSVSDNTREQVIGAMALLMASPAFQYK
jgi:uncharacterized protein (DUF1800 family)